MKNEFINHYLKFIHTFTSFPRNSLALDLISSYLCIEIELHKL